MQYALDSYMLSNKVHTQFSIPVKHSGTEFLFLSLPLSSYENTAKRKTLLLSINFLLPNGSFKNDGASLRY